MASSPLKKWVRSPCLVVVCGLSGAGKSAVAGALSERTGFTHVNSDVVRKELAGIPVDQHTPGGAVPGLYSPQSSARTYAEMFARARAALGAGGGAIVDATFQRSADRGAARALARNGRVPILIVECRCGEEEVRRRLSERTRRGKGPSDADWEIYCQQRTAREPFAAEELDDRLIVDTSGGIREAVAAVEDALRARLGR